MNVELPPELEIRIQQEAQKQGVDATAYALQLLSHSLPPRRLSARELLRLPCAERDRYLARAAEDAAPLYNADLARPVVDRELTAFTALDGEPYIEDNEAAHAGA